MAGELISAGELEWARTAGPFRSSSRSWCAPESAIRDESSQVEVVPRLGVCAGELVGVS